MFLIAAGLAATLWMQSDGVKVPVHNVSARYMLVELAQQRNIDFEAGVESPFAKNVRIFVNPKGNGLLVHGPEAGVNDIARMVSLFDVKPQVIRLEVVASVPGFGYERSSDIAVSNNTPFRIEDATADLGLEVTPRFNGDRTVTLHFAVNRSGRQIETRLRVLANDWVRLFVPAEGALTYESNTSLEWVLKKGPRATEQDAVILVRATVPEG